MTAEDEIQFLDYVRSLGSLSILPHISPASEFQPVSSLPVPMEQESTRRFWLYRTIAGMPLVTEEEPEKGRWTINGYQSPVIEFWRPWTASKVILAGGIEAETMWINDELQDLDKKPMEFQEWIDAIYDWIRENYYKLGGITFAGPSAENFKDEGGIFQGR